MALWKPFLGTRTTLDTVEKHPGYVYWCADDGSLHFDYTDADGNLQRKQINAKDAEALCGMSLDDLKSHIATQDVAILHEAQAYTDQAIEAVEGAVLYTEQTLSDEQKAQARKNISVPTKVSELENDKNYLDNTFANGVVIPHMSSTDIHITTDERTAWNAKLDESELDSAINTALAEAKASGEFDGAKGDSGVYVGSGEMPEDCNVQIDPNGNGDTFTIPDVLQETGNSTVDTMSQKAITEEFNSIRAKGLQQTPLFANSIEECTDTTKLYVLPDGYIYRYMKQTKEVETTVIVPAKAAVIDGKRYSHSSQAFVDNTGGSCIVVPIDYTADTLEIVVTGITLVAGTYMGTGNVAFTGNVSSTLANNTITITDATVLNNIEFNKYNFIILRCSTPYVDTATLTYNGEEIELVSTDDSTIAAPSTTTITTEIVEIEEFFNTGHAFVPADYEDRIISLEKTVKDIDMEEDLADYLNSVHCPVQLPANEETGADFNLHTFADFGDGFHSYFDDLLVRYPHYLVREYLGKDASGTLNMYRYILGKHYYSAWCKENYPRMYAWKNGETVIYSVSVAPRIDDTMYSTTYVGTAYATVTAVNATNRSRTVNGLEFVRYADGDVEPTLVYTPSHNPYNQIWNSNDVSVGNISAISEDGHEITINDSASTVYVRYPFGDLPKGKKPLVHMTIIANEHGGDTEPAIPAVVTARFIRDLCNGQCSSDNPLYRFLRDNVQITIIPTVNPHGLNKFPADVWDGYHNANNVNINRNYDTAGWDVYLAENPDEAYRMGKYAGSENETQYVMNTMVDSKANVAMSVHTISCLVTGYKTRCMYQGQNPNGGYSQNKIDEIADDMKASYNLDFVAYSPLECPPETTSKSPSYITQIGAYGGIVEFQCHNPLATEEEISTDASMFTSDVMEQNYSLLLKFIAMWLSDYLEGGITNGKNI